MNTSAAIQQLADTIRQTFEEKRRFMATQPQSIECPRHGTARPIDEGRTRFDGHGGFLAGYADCQYCQAEAQEQRDEARLLACGVPRALLHATLDNWEPEGESGRDILEAAKTFAAVRKGFLILTGPVGCGKSHLAAGIARACLKAVPNPWFVSQGELLAMLRDTYRDDGAVDPVGKARRAGLFVLDELGVSANGKDLFPMLHNILASRYADKRPTILTSNLPVNEFEPVVGPRIMDRIRECAIAVIELTGKSHRGSREVADRYLFSE